MAETQVPHAATPVRRRIVFTIAATALLMAAIDQTIVATALNTLRYDLHTSVTWAGWTITVYALTQILVMPVAGALSDLFGRRRLFLGAIIVFTLASVCCGLSTNIVELVVLRAVQAVGGGAFLPSATGIVADAFESDRDRAVGLFTSIFPIGAITGPVLGGVFVTYLSWRGIFLVNLPIGVVLFRLAIAVVPRSDASRGTRVDYTGIALLGGGLLGTMLAISSIGEGDIRVGAFLGVGVISLAALIRHSIRAQEAFLPVRFLSARPFATMNAINMLMGSALFGTASLLPLYAQIRFGLSPLSSGTLLTARAVGTIAVSAGSVMLLRRTGYRPPMIVGFVMAAAGTAWLALLDPTGGHRYGWLAVAAAVSGIGSGIALPAANNATLNLAPERAASISGLRGMFRQAGGITGLSVAAVVVSRAGNPGQAQAHVFIAFAVVLAALVPLALFVPDHRGAW